MSLDPEGMLLASIMAKKHSVSSNHVLIDIPVGPDVKILDAAHAKHLKKRFMQIGKMLGMKVQVIITDGSQPIGYGIGPMLEMIDVINVLKNDPAAPQDLREKAIMESAVLLELTGKAKKGAGKKMAEQILNSGKAWKKFNQIITAQGKKRMPPMAKFQQPVKAKIAGTVKTINNKTVAHIARLAGAPKDVASGVVIHKKLGDKIAKNDALFTIHANSADRVKYAMEFAKTDCGYTVK
jgi:thymidine phosphorylase